ncbi:hypothetical protein ZYGR_0I04130 [Zygosaccharomyces rouxii]|uniref:Protein SWT21 n=1 Tax=Zygosaccharomyces rouxii TaxID=4956 RepID=A0A1Q2ZX50_ZYGRO|nr:hypothetical protein ZYGR_0I04130 [Zygosaccharomyces rouxii]
MYAELKDGMGTRDVFDGWNVQKVWQKEDEAWINRTQNSGMKLQNPAFAQGKNWERPVICQDIFWSRDGSSIVTIHDDYGIRQYVMSLEGNTDQLVPYSRMFKSQSIVTGRVHPLYSLYNDTEDFNVLLTACKDLPLQMYSLQDTEGPCLNHYNVINNETGNWEIPHAINWSNEDHFLIGSVKNRVSLFSCYRSSPIWTSQSKRGNSTSKSIVSCFSERPYGEFSNAKHTIFGTYKNELHLLDHRTQHPQFLHRSAQGRGYIQLLESFNGHYLYALKRNTNLIDVLDTRESHRPVNQLQLPFTMGNQKHKASITSTNGLTIGTDDGKIVCWSSNAIEFGVIDRNGLTCDNGAGEKPELTHEMGLNSSRINIVQQSPTDFGVCALSYSPDKMTYRPDVHASSGIYVTELPTDWFGL